MTVPMAAAFARPRHVRPAHAAGRHRRTGALDLSRIYRCQCQPCTAHRRPLLLLLPCPRRLQYPPSCQLRPSLVRRHRGCQRRGFVALARAGRRRVALELRLAVLVLLLVLALLYRCRRSRGPLLRARGVQVSAAVAAAAAAVKQQAMSAQQPSLLGLLPLLLLRLLLLARLDLLLVVRPALVLVVRPALVLAVHLVLVLVLVLSLAQFRHPACQSCHPHRLRSVLRRQLALPPPPLLQLHRRHVTPQSVMPPQLVLVLAVLRVLASVSASARRSRNQWSSPSLHQLPRAWYAQPLQQHRL